MSKTSTKKSSKVANVMHEYKEDSLHSGISKKIVTDRKQAIAIALSVAREDGASIPKKSATKKKTVKK